ncbi:unnamed protein product [Nesidiocoris tenuis]|uniref:Uncharacterized protein n=1 Tax=Nesidiocoris tenuis TaxID=355587 RepID=A0A6H5GGW9_9HEMI|nr:unnamed protein product [Nesidiocoris tenuis]
MLHLSACPFGEKRFLIELTSDTANIPRAVMMMRMQARGRSLSQGGEAADPLRAPARARTRDRVPRTLTLILTPRHCKPGNKDS